MRFKMLHVFLSTLYVGYELGLRRVWAENIQIPILERNKIIYLFNFYIFKIIIRVYDEFYWESL